MKSFLAQVAAEIYAKHTKSLGELVLVLPSKRAVTFLKNELQNLVEMTTISPAIVSIEEFIQDLANLKLASNIQLSFEFYEVYKEITPKEEREDFYSFTTWSQTVLQDFNEIDRYLIDPKSFFTHLFHIKELDQFHWTNSENKTDLQKNYLSFWKRLYHYYEKFNEHLVRKGIGYQGMLYREANENVEFYVQNNNRTHIFIGFNALNEAEKNIFQEFLSQPNTAIYWDIDEKFMTEKEHDAGLFLRKYQKEWPYFKSNPFNIISNDFSQEKNIHIIGVPKNVGQAKYAGSILKENEKYVSNTAVVLGNESLLGALLNSIPPEIQTANITSGFPLHLSPFASFFETLLDVWSKASDTKWYYQDVINVLASPIAHTLYKNNSEEVLELLQKVRSQNLIYVEHELLESIQIKGTSLFFSQKERNVNTVIQNCIDIALGLKKAYNEESVKNSLFLEYLYRFYEVFNQLKTFNASYGTITDLKSLKKVYAELLSLETVDFKGEPLQGLQIMGMLESRNLDFENVILTSVNEGILPAGKTSNSFIPFDLKIAFGLPTYKEKDAIYSYHFYRLLQKAKNIYLLYNTEADVLEGGEKSRLLQQLVMLKEEKHTIHEYIASPTIKNAPVNLAEIPKNTAILQKLKEVANRGFSPTSLSNYIRNPIDFYQKSVLGIKEVEDVEETIAANTLGTIVHDTLETFYKPLEGTFLTIEHIKQMKDSLNGTVNLHFSKTYTETKTLRGKNLIAYHVAKRYIQNFLSFEERRLQKGNQIKIIQIENNLKVPIEIPELNFPIYLKGKVDRVEEVNGEVIIVDYKTGKVEKKDVTISDWDTLTDDYKYSKAFQILCYAYMMNQNTPFNNFEGAILSFKNMGSGLLKFSTKEGAIVSDNPNAINAEVLKVFQERLKGLLLEIFNTEIPFQEKEIIKNGY
ncbi:PD-(D/E)XK nuclease family protein [Galbibacter mesophilus]|uniref:PD-(D/E)XK nuclease family protein n=1 Tax=Galbibacter mesophilus TaxID=379069 RepID=UPI00191CA028|nr:PD-(D/E)XK nuclease family protein [Galbibacter mesophilus]MCM5662104.1 PD-(D/E)XK nuclease family protein [Galbibacter mesophilus]